MPGGARAQAPRAGTAPAQDYTGRRTGWGAPWRGEPTRQEPALLSNHDGAAAPGPARLCNDLKQEGRPQAPTPFQNMGHKSEDLGPGTWNLDLNLDLTSTLDSTTAALVISMLVLPLPLTLTLTLLADAGAGPVAVLVTPLPHAIVPHPSETRGRLLLLLL